VRLSVPEIRKPSRIETFAGLLEPVDVVSEIHKPELG
jgi:hypothetical protein